MEEAQDPSDSTAADGIALTGVYSDAIEALARRQLGGDRLTEAEVTAICAAVIETIDSRKAALRSIIGSLSSP